MISGVGTSNYYMGQMSSMGRQSGSAGMAKPPSPEEMFNEVDSDGSGGVDQTEFSALASKISEATGEDVDIEDIYETYDEDGDGVLSEEETQAVMEANRPQGPPPGGGMMGGMGGPPPGMSQMISDADEDEDGSIDETESETLAEIISEISGEEVDAEELFATYDEDGDGVLSAEETSAAMEAYRPEDPPPQGGMMTNTFPFNKSAGIANYSQMFALGGNQNNTSGMASLFGGQGSDSSGSWFSVNTRV